MMKIAEPHFDKAELEELKDCLESGWVTQGPKTAVLENLFAVRHNTSYALATTSCTAGLHLSTLALDLRPGDEVIVPAFTWITSANCAEYVGARAVFVDIEPGTYNIDPVSFESAITDRTRAVIAVHLFGLSADMDSIINIARSRDISVIEDAACAIGTSYKGQPVGGLGDVASFSLHPRKVITTGEGGMVTTNSEYLSQRIASLRNHGASAPDGDIYPWTMNRFDMLGFNLRLSDIQAAVGIAQFAKLDSLLKERRALALRYSELLAGIQDIVLPTAATDVADVDGHTFQSYVIRLIEGGRERRNAVMSLMAEADIQTRPGTHAVHQLGYYREKYGLRPDQFPIASACEDTTITLPLFPGMKNSDQEKVVDCLCKGLTRKI